jgi:hypothetical protein
MSLHGVARIAVRVMMGQRRISSNPKTSWLLQLQTPRV